MFTAPVGTDLIKKATIRPRKRWFGEERDTRDTRDTRQRTRACVSIDGELTARLAAKPAQTVVGVNISTSGMAVVMDEFLGSPGDTFALALQIAHSGEWVSVMCRVDYVLGEQAPLPDLHWLYGLVFIDMERDCRAAVESYVAYRFGQRAALTSVAASAQATQMQ